MITSIENKFLKVAVKTVGAEICSIQSQNTGTEYIWEGDPKIWGRHAPILFPIVGKVKEDTYRVRDQILHLGQHGFARDQEFQIVHKSKNRIEYQLSSSAETLANYPFRFQLSVVYTLDEHILKTAYKVENTDTEVMWFSIGAHPGFRCPLRPEERFEDYTLVFEKEECAARHLIEGGLFTGEKELFLDHEANIPLSKDLFQKDALVFKDLLSESIVLRDKNHRNQIRVGFKGFPYLGIWTKPEEGDFICIEPWYGLADSMDHNGDFQSKEGILSLQAGEAFLCSYTFQILETKRE